MVEEGKYCYFYAFSTASGPLERDNMELMRFFRVYSGRGMPRGGMMNPMPRGFNGPPMRGRGGMMRGPPRGMGFRCVITNYFCGGGIRIEIIFVRITVDFSTPTSKSR